MAAISVIGLCCGNFNLSKMLDMLSNSRNDLVVILVNNIHGKYADTAKVRSLSSRQFHQSKMLDMKEVIMAMVYWESEACRFIKEEVAFYTTLIYGYVCIRKTKFTSGKLKAIKAKATTACSIPIMGLPTMWPTFWLGPSMARLLVGPREEQNCSK